VALPIARGRIVRAIPREALADPALVVAFAGVA